MELRIYNSEAPWDDFSYPLRVGRRITSLTWCFTGERLLVGDSLGRLSVFTMIDNLSSDWEENGFFMILKTELYLAITEMTF